MKLCMQLFNKNDNTYYIIYIHHKSESFKVLVKELQSLGLSVDVSNAEGAISFASEADSESPGRLGINLTGFEEEDIFDVGS